ncbi:hypothetical protein QFZ22_007068 [Streptomyces canus]|uniref:Uncharacterized protein n=1 Tax=Streptomyces canus TaxID=58343 RepID=A0AAW8FMB2_9ACTN|nr:hypothetical protein [Streptomyces canus]
MPLNVLLKAREVAYHLTDSDAKASFAFEGSAEPNWSQGRWLSAASRPVGMAGRKTAGQPIRCSPSPKSMRARSARETIPSLGNTLAR